MQNFSYLVDSDRDYRPTPSAGTHGDSEARAADSCTHTPAAVVDCTRRAAISEDFEQRVEVDRWEGNLRCKADSRQEVDGVGAGTARMAEQEELEVVVHSQVQVQVNVDDAYTQSAALHLPSEVLHQLLLDILVLRRFL